VQVAYPMFNVGFDLSGPSNTADTALVAFKLGCSRLTLHQCLSEAENDTIHVAVRRLCSQDDAAVGINAPLSYNLGGDDRPCDADLRKRCIEARLHPGSVMAPTMTRMAYLTFLAFLDLATELLPPLEASNERCDGQLRGNHHAVTKRIVVKQRHGIEVSNQRRSAHK